MTANCGMQVWQHFTTAFIVKWALQAPNDHVRAPATAITVTYKMVFYMLSTDWLHAAMWCAQLLCDRPQVQMTSMSIFSTSICFFLHTVAVGSYLAISQWYHFLDFTWINKLITNTWQVRLCLCNLVFTTRCIMYKRGMCLWCVLLPLM